ncbi:MAG: rhomboid family intramembrane serine protease [bacterium]|nr:rhomboid family intramembrane serine protease [bacterium]
MFIPIRDDVPSVRTPYVTIGLISVNALVFLYSIMLGSRGFQLFTIQFGFIPAELVHSLELTPTLPASVYLTAFSSMFMHGGWMHLIGNMLFLWIYGNNIENYFGPVKFLIFYLISGLAAIALFTLFGPNGEVPLVGASGAIAGVMGGYMVLHPRAKITVLMLFIFIQFIELPAKTVLGIWFVYQIVMSLVNTVGGGGVAWMAHVGGFLFGWLILKLLVKIWRKGSTPSGGQRVYRMQW